MRIDPPFFINYRIADSVRESEILYLRLLIHFPEKQVFRDAQGIKAGDEYPQVIRDALARSRTVFVVIGQNWLNAKTDQHKLRLFEPSDWVHDEIFEALNDRKAVIPILVDDTKMPTKDQLPKTIAALSRIQFVRVGFSSNESRKDLASILPNEQIPGMTNDLAIAKSIVVAIAGRNQDLRGKLSDQQREWLEDRPDLEDHFWEIVRDKARPDVGNKIVIPERIKRLKREWLKAID